MCIIPAPKGAGCEACVEPIFNPHLTPHPHPPFLFYFSRPRCIREHANDGPGFKERKADALETATLRKYLLEFAATGEVQGWAPAHQGGVYLNNSRATVVKGLRDLRCEMWRSAGFGPEFWWAN